MTHYTWGPDQTKLTPSALHNNQKERAKQFRRHLPFPLRYFYSYTVHYTIYRADIKQTDREQVAQTNTQYFAIDKQITITHGRRGFSQSLSKRLECQGVEACKIMQKNTTMGALHLGSHARGMHHSLHDHCVTLGCRAAWVRIPPPYSL